MNNDSTTQYTPPQAQLKKSRKGLKRTGLLILLLVLIGAAGYGIYAWQQNSSLSIQLQNAQQEKEQLASQNTSLAKELDEAKKKTGLALTDEEAAKKAAQLYIDAQTLDTKYIVNVKVEGNFAVGSISPETKPTFVPGGLYLKKVQSEWIVIWAGQNGPDKTTGEKFGLPEEWYSSTN